VVPGVDWDFPGAGFRAVDSQPAHDMLDAVAERIRQLVPANEPVAIFSQFDGLLYVMAERRPFSRFVPVYRAPVLDDQVEEVLDALRHPTLHWVFYDGAPQTMWSAVLVPQLVRRLTLADFERVDTVQQFEVWHRGAPAPPS